MMWEPAYMEGLEPIDKHFAWANLIILGFSIALFLFAVTMMIVERRII